MKLTILIVGIGGMIGSILRYLAALYITKAVVSSFPFGTFVVNLFGSLLIGMFYGLAQRYSWFTPQWRIFLTTGLCGGFTTFSSFAYENVQLLQNSNYSSFALYSISSFALCLLAVVLGIYLIKIW